MIIQDYGPVILVLASVAITIAAGAGVSIGRKMRGIEEKLRADKAEAELAMIRMRRSAATAKGNRTKAAERQRLLRKTMLDLRAEHVDHPGSGAGQ